MSGRRKPIVDSKVERRQVVVPEVLASSGRDASPQPSLTDAPMKKRKAPVEFRSRALSKKKTTPVDASAKSSASTPALGDPTTVPGSSRVPSLEVSPLAQLPALRPLPLEVPSTIVPSPSRARSLEPPKGSSEDLLLLEQRPARRGALSADSNRPDKLRSEEGKSGPAAERLCLPHRPFILKPGGIHVSEGFKWTDEDAYLGLKPLMTPEMSRKVRDMETADECAEYLLAKGREMLDGVFALARRSARAEHISGIRKANMDKLSLGASKFAEEAEVAKKQLEEATRIYEGTVAQVQTLSAEVEKLRADQSTWTASITRIGDERDAAVQRAEVAEQVTKAAQEEAEAVKAESVTLKEEAAGMREEMERLKGDRDKAAAESFELKKSLEQLQAQQEEAIDQAVRDYADSDQVTLLAGVEVADTLTKFVCEYAAELPVLTQKLEEYKRAYDLDPAWFEKATQRSQQQP